LTGFESDLRIENGPSSKLAKVRSYAAKSEDRHTEAEASMNAKERTLLHITSKKMGDHSNEALESQSRRDAEVCARRLLEPSRLNLNEDSLPWILNHIDCFISQSRGNKSVEHVFLYPYSVDGHDDDCEVLDKVGQAIGNTQVATYCYSRLP
jgi:hypothetical protein